MHSSAISGLSVAIDAIASTAARIERGNAWAVMICWSTSARARLTASEPSEIGSPIVGDMERGSSSIVVGRLSSCGGGARSSRFCWSLIGSSNGVLLDLHAAEFTQAHRDRNSDRRLDGARIEVGLEPFDGQSLVIDDPPVESPRARKIERRSHRPALRSPEHTIDLAPNRALLAPDCALLGARDPTQDRPPRDRVLFISPISTMELTRGLMRIIDRQRALKRLRRSEIDINLTRRARHRLSPAPIDTETARSYSPCF